MKRGLVQRCLRSRFATTAATGAGVTAMLLAGLWYFQESLLYHPVIAGVAKLTKDNNPPRFRSPQAWGLPFREQYVRTRDGMRVHLWFILGSRPAGVAALPTVLFFHGNAGNIGWRLPFAQWLVGAGCNVIMADYRGYGMSSGTPNEEGLALDAEAVLDFAMEQPEVDPARITTYGRSLGGAVAIRLAHDRPDQIAGVIAENTFTSIADMVNHLFPVLKPFKWFLTMHFESVKLAPVLKQPVLLISGDRDGLVPPSHMQKLHDVFSARDHGRSSELVRVPGGEHDDTWHVGGKPLLQAITTFVRGTKLSKPPATPPTSSHAHKSGDHAPRSEL